MQKLHLKCKLCRSAICECRSHSSPFLGLAGSRAAFGLSRLTVSEWRMKCYKTAVKSAVALPTAASSMGSFQMQQRHIVDGGAICRQRSFAMTGHLPRSESCPYRMSFPPDQWLNRSKGGIPTNHSRILRRNR